MAAITLYDVARRAGVSQATASRVLNGSARLPGAQVSTAVRRAAAELGYIPNAQAQALARSATGLLGVVVHDIADPYFSSIARGVQTAARAASSQVLLTSTDRDPELELSGVGAFISYRTDAIVLVGSRRVGRNSSARLQQELERFSANGGRVAVVGQRLPGCHSVVPCNADGARDLAEALVALGHRRFAILSGPTDLQTAKDRTGGFAKALARRGISLEATIAGEFTRDGGYAAAERLLHEVDLRPGRLCVFAVNDVMALGAMAYWRSVGRQVPQDLCIAGFDDIPTLRDHSPSLTTVRLPLEAIGEQAATLALSTSLTSPQVVEVAGEVVLRESTALTLESNG